MTNKQDIYNERYGVTISESGEVYIYDLETEKPKELVAEVFGQDEEAIALANLMAATPDLLWAAECAHTFISDILELGFSQSHEVKGIEEGLREAIRKARGEQ